jgi:hypothetical protein
VDTKQPRVRRTVFSAALMVIVLALAPAALADKGGKNSPSNNGSSSLTLNMVADANGDGLASWGDTVSFTVSAPTTEPNVELLCSQNGVVVYAAQTGYYSNTWPSTRDMRLTSQAWPGGAASCTARLYALSGANTTTLATLSFTAGA